MAKTSSIQLDLFSEFFADTPERKSNTLVLWDAIPKYTITRHSVRSIRNKDGLSPSITRDFLFDGRMCELKIQPALIKDPSTGREVACFPGPTEELVEEALKKILVSQQGGGWHDPKTPETWVRFSINHIDRILSEYGRSRPRGRIHQALEILASCVLTIRCDGKELWKGTILQDLVLTNRGKGGDGFDALHAARFALFVSMGINELSYRQFDLQVFFDLPGPLERWLYRKLVHRFTQASMLHDYNIRLSTVVAESGLVNGNTVKRQRERLAKALKSLTEYKVLRDWEETPHREGRSIIGATYVLKPGSWFTREQISANQRLKKQKNTLLHT